MYTQLPFLFKGPNSVQTHLRIVTCQRSGLRYICMSNQCSCRCSDQ